MQSKGLEIESGIHVVTGISYLMTESNTICNTSLQLVWVYRKVNRQPGYNRVLPAVT